MQDLEGAVAGGTALTLVIVGLCLRARMVAPLAAVVVVTFASGLVCLIKLGGITGDCFGASSQLAAIAVYLCGVGLSMTEGDSAQLGCTILLVRHAPTGMAGRFCGESDPVLSEQGRQQSAKLAEELEKQRLAHLLSSDLRRIQEAASYIAAKSGLTAELLPGLLKCVSASGRGLTGTKSAKGMAYSRSVG